MFTHRILHQHDSLFACLILSILCSARPQNGSMILYNRKKVKYRKDGYCWKKRKDGKTTREDHMKLKVQGVEVRGCSGKTSRWFAAVYGFTANLVLNVRSSPLRRHIHVAQMNTWNAESTGQFVSWKWAVPLFLSLSPSSSPRLTSSLFLKDKSVFGLRPEMMSMPPSAEQRGVSIQSQGSVCACVWVCVFESHQPAQKLIIQQECSRRWEEWACMCQKQKEWGGEWSKGETLMRHMDVYRRSRVGFALKVNRKQVKK